MTVRGGGGGGFAVEKIRQYRDPVYDCTRTCSNPISKPRPAPISGNLFSTVVGGGPRKRLAPKEGEVSPNASRRPERDEGFSVNVFTFGLDELRDCCSRTTRDDGTVIEDRRGTYTHNSPAISTSSLSLWHPLSSLSFASKPFPLSRTRSRFFAFSRFRSSDRSIDRY